LTYIAIYVGDIDRAASQIEGGGDLLSTPPFSKFGGRISLCPFLWQVAWGSPFKLSTYPDELKADGINRWKP